MIRRLKAGACVSALAALGLVLALAVRPAPAQTPAAREMVADVVIIGNRNIATEKIMREIHTRPGLEFSAQRIQDDINRLAKTHLFKHLAVRTQNTSDGRSTVIFEVQEHPNLVREVVFKHAKHLTDDELLTMTRVRKGMPLDKTLNQLAVYEIQDALKKKGRHLASVTLEEGFDEAHDRVVFNITEGPIVRVRSTSFAGNIELATEARLRTQIDTSRAVLGTFGGTYVPQMIDEDVHKLEEYYRKNGYLNVRVSRDVTFSDDFQYVDVVFHVEEGIRFKVKRLAIEGTKTQEIEKLKTIPRLKEKEWYNDDVVTADTKNIADFFGWRGYPANVQKIVTSVPDEPGVVNVQYLVEERAPVKVGRVIIVGNTVTQDSVIRRALGLYPGQILRFPELRLAENSLTRLGIFETDPEKGNRPTVQAVPSESDPNFQDIVVNVKETHTGSFQVGAGYNTNNGLLGSIVLNERNFDIMRFPTSWEDFVEGKAFRGANQELRLEAVPGTQLQRYSATWRNPMVFDLPYSLIVSGYYRQQYYNEYLESRPGARVTVAKQLTPYWSIAAGFRIEEINVQPVDGAPVDYTSVQGNNFLFAPRVGVTYDDRDSFMIPSQGSLVDLSFEQAFGKYVFPIINLQASRYFTVTQRKDGSGKQVLSLRSQVGIEGENAPVYERYFAGGMQSIRGFQYRGVGPNVNGFMVGGTFLFLNSIEYRVPILANDNLSFVTFIDSGTSESKIGITDYRVSAGFGFRITIPALGPVPIALDFGFPINRVASDTQQVFNIWFGMYH